MPQTQTRADARWQAAAQEHGAALARFAETARRAAPQAWTQPMAPGKWTPAQVTEHLALSYEALLRELRGDGTMQLKLTPAHRAVLRWLLLPHMLFHRTFPRGARAPRELRPGEPPADRDEGLARLALLAGEFEHEADRARRAGGGRLTHPYFGRVAPTKVLRFCAVHLEHHTRQMPVLTSSSI